jgi:hypothetical protein
MNCKNETLIFNFFFYDSQRPPSSSLSYGGAMNDDVRSPGSGSTPGPLAQPPPGLGDTDPGEFYFYYTNFNMKFEASKNTQFELYKSVIK